MRIERLAIGTGKAVAIAAMLLWSLLPIGFIALSSVKPARDIFAVPPRVHDAAAHRPLAALEQLLYRPVQQPGRYRRCHGARRDRQHAGRLRYSRHRSRAIPQRTFLVACG
jgi:hypothetical protein